MSELLIELFCEEIPAMMQKKAKSAYLDIFTKYFQGKKIGFENIEIFIGPRRIVIHALDLDKQTKSQAISIKGPKIDAPNPAIEGFCKSNNIDKKDLITREIKDQECYFYEKEIAGQETSTILLNSLHEPIMEYVWPKSMHWSDYRIKWIRPIRNILCVFAGEIIPFKLGHLTANNITYGHRFMSPDFIKVTNFTNYKKDLANNFVILSHAERLNIIKKALFEKANSLNLTIKDDPDLLEEVSGLAEFPVVMIGTIDQKFLKLPSEILVSSMRLHQKYFSLFDKEGNFAPYFLFVSNINPDNPDNVIKGNEKVLSARLSDALYFYNQDTKKTLESRKNALVRIIFHAKLGSLASKTERLSRLVQFIDPKAINAFDAAAICKSDILSEVVGEFPNLQGIIGYYYALNDGKNKEVATAIRDHYKPQGPSDSAPLGDGAYLALADKMDSLCGLIIAGEKPTGSKDPYAIRRLALGIIRIILENNLQQNIIKLIEFSCDLYSPIIKANSDDINQIIFFIEERAKNYFKDEFGHDQINAVVNLAVEQDLLVTKWKLEALTKFLASDDGNDLLNSYKRASNILANKSPQGLVNEKFFDSKYENDLFETLSLNKKKIDNAIEAKNFLESLQILASMKMIIANFFDNVMVMDENPEIANNRLLLLDQTKMVFNRIVNFDHL